MPLLRRARSRPSIRSARSSWACSGRCASWHCGADVHRAARRRLRSPSSLGIALTDLRHYLIPDGFTVTGLLWLLGTALVAPFIEETLLFAGPYDALIGACVGAGVIAIVGWLGEVALKREAMGMGDVTLMAFVGAALGPARALVTVFLGAASARSSS